MVERAVAGETGRAEEEFGEDDTRGPDVDGGRVGSGAEEEFRRAVPDADDAGGEGLSGTVVARHAEICCFGVSWWFLGEELVNGDTDFEHGFGSEEDVLHFDVAEGYRG